MAGVERRLLCGKGVEITERVARSANEARKLLLLACAIAGLGGAGAGRLDGAARPGRGASRGAEPAATGRVKEWARVWSFVGATIVLLTVLSLVSLSWAAAYSAGYKDGYREGKLGEPPMIG